MHSKLQLMGTSEASEESSFELVASHVANLLNEGQVKTALAETDGSRFLDESMALLAQQRWDQFVSKMVEMLDLVFAKCSDKDAECIANVLVHAVARAPEDKVAAAAQQMAKALSAKVDERSEERLSALLNLYAVTSVPAVQYSVLITALEFARKHPRLAHSMSAVVRGRSEEWVRQWRLSEAQARDLYVSLAAVVKASNDRAAPKEYLRLMTHALQLAKDGDTAALSQLKPHAIAAVTDFIRNPSVFQSDLVDLAAIRQLASDPQHAPLYSLLKAILSGDLAGYRAAATPAALELAGVTADAALFKARMVSLLALCSEAASHHEEVAFGALAKALDVPVEQVEMWIVRAIGAKLIEGRIDQVRSVVTVSRSTQRTFGTPEWQALRAQLLTWKDSLAAVVQNLGQLQANLATGQGSLPGGAAKGPSSAAGARPVKA